MMKLLISIKDHVIKFNDFLKKMEQMPLRRFHGDFYEEEEDKKPAKRAPRKNNVSVEDLRHQRPTDESNN